MNFSLHFKTNLGTVIKISLFIPSASKASNSLIWLLKVALEGESVILPDVLDERLSWHLIFIVFMSSINKRVAGLDNSM